MKRPRLTISGLMFVVLILGLDLAALASPDHPWVNVVTATTLGLLFWSGYAAARRQGAARGFWLGWAAFSGLYLSFVPHPWLLAGPNGLPLLLPVADLIDALYLLIKCQNSGRIFETFKESGYSPDFYAIGNAILGQSFGLVGGCLFSLSVVFRKGRGLRKDGPAGSGSEGAAP